jgi:protein-disulfide isomerase
MQRRTFLKGALSGAALMLPAGSVLAQSVQPQAFTRSFGEVFAFTCPYCYKLAFNLIEWLPTRPHVKHFPIHIISQADDLKTAAAFYAAKLLGRGDAYRLALYKAVHESQQTLDEKVLVKAAEMVGLDAATFVAKIRSQEVAELIARSEQITKLFQVQVTPTLIIDMQRPRTTDREPLEILSEEFPV